MFLEQVFKNRLVGLDYNSRAVTRKEMSCTCSLPEDALRNRLPRRVGGQVKKKGDVRASSFSNSKILNKC